MAAPWKRSNNCCVWYMKDFRSADCCYWCYWGPSSPSGLLRESVSAPFFPQCSSVALQLVLHSHVVASEERKDDSAGFGLPFGLFRSTRVYVLVARPYRGSMWSKQKLKQVESCESVQKQRRTSLRSRTDPNPYGTTWLEQGGGVKKIQR